MAKTPMTKEAAARIQSRTAKANNGQTPKGSFGARAQRAADKNISPKGGKK
jgi:hypothetical protein